MNHPQHLIETLNQSFKRRRFLTGTAQGFGYAALGSLLGLQTGGHARAAAPLLASSQGPGIGGLPSLPHFAPKAKRVIYFHMVGGPAQMDLYDYKPVMNDWYDKDLPESVRAGQRLTTMTSGQSRFPIAPSKFAFKQHGQSGMWVSELLPYTSKMADDMCFIRSMHTEAINHEPAITFIQSGNQITGRPCIGSWLSYGLGSMNENLPTFVVLVAEPSNTEQVQAISARLWASGFLPGQHAGVSFRSKGDPILYINNPPGVTSDVRRKTLDGINQLNRIAYEKIGDPETNTRIEQYEMAFRMQASVPELTDLSQESNQTFELYGEAAKKPGTFANTALMSRRLVERGVRFVQVYHNNWDTHGNSAGRLPDQCRDVDQPCWGLIQDLKQRGMLDDTLVIWGGEFGRTIYSQGGLSRENYGRDHHPRCFTMWMAGGGIKPGTIYGETDEFSYNIVRDPVHVRDFHATILHLLGIEHDRFTFKAQGLDSRLTGVEHARIIKEILA
ncbi:MAG TPA: sulfatase [Planctomycetaceae bacterium]|nr:sulfatase [Planctomycetaceae bacterium]